MHFPVHVYPLLWVPSACNVKLRACSSFGRACGTRVCMRLMRVRNHVCALSSCACGAVCSLVCASCACGSACYVLHAQCGTPCMPFMRMWNGVYALHAHVERRVCASCACGSETACTCLMCMRGTVLYALHAHGRLGVCAPCACNAEYLLLCAPFACMYVQPLRMHAPGIRFMHARNCVCLRFVCTWSCASARAAGCWLVWVMFCCICCERE